MFVLVDSKTVYITYCTKTRGLKSQTSTESIWAYETFSQSFSGLTGYIYSPVKHSQIGNKWRLPFCTNFSLLDHVEQKVWDI